VVVANYFELLRETYLGRRAGGGDLQTHFKNAETSPILPVLRRSDLLGTQHCSLSGVWLGLDVVVVVLVVLVVVVVVMVVVVVFSGPKRE